MNSERERDERDLAWLRQRVVRGTLSHLPNPPRQNAYKTTDAIRDADLAYSCPSEAPAEVLRHYKWKRRSRK